MTDRCKQITYNLMELKVNNDRAGIWKVQVAFSVWHSLNGAWPSDLKWIYLPMNIQVCRFNIS